MPKTIRNRYDKMLTYENLMEAHKKSEKGKRRKDEIIKFDLKKEEYIRWLYIQLKNRTYKHGDYSEFYVSEPKLRKIEKARYLDRIVHKWVVDSFLMDTFVKSFISTSYACIRKKGMHNACLDVQRAMQKCERIWGEYYIIKTDVYKFFNSIDKEILLKILAKRIKDKKIMWLIKEILYKNPRQKGIEIGNYTSQTFANIYLNEFDYFVKHTLHLKYYFRYMDDSISFVRTKQEAKEIMAKMENFLNQKLELKLNDKTQIFKSKQGVNFCGYKINPYRLKIRTGGKKKLKKKVIKMQKQIKTGKITSKEAKKYLAGHYGYIKIADTYNLEKKLFPAEFAIDKIF